MTSSAYKSNGHNRRVQPSPDVARLLDKLPPSAIEAECAVLGSMILDWRCVGDVLQTISAADFYRPNHAAIYDTLVELYDKNQSIDMVQLNQRLIDKQQISQVGGLEYLMELAESVPSAVSANHYAAIVREKSMLRRLIDASALSLHEAYNSGAPATEVLEQAEHRIFEIAQSAEAGRQNQNISDLMHAAYDLVTGDTQQTAGIPTGFIDLDAHLGGLQKGDLIILAARPSAGKTALSLNIAEHVAVNTETPCLVLSMEMSKEQIAQRLLASRSGVAAKRMRGNAIGLDEFTAMQMAVGALAMSPLLIDDTPGLTVLSLRAKARRAAAQHHVKLIVIDYLQLMTAPGAESRQQEVSNISRSLKALARELEVPVLCLSQLNRQSEHRENHRPRMSDLRESGCLAGDTLITLADSGERVPIVSLVGQSGFRVWARDGRATRASVCSRCFSTGVKPAFRIQTNTGKTITATANHQFLTPAGWRRLDELSIGQHLACYANLPEPKVTALFDDDHLFLLGHMIGNGSVLSNHAAQYTTKHADLAGEVRNRGQRFFGSEVSPHIVFDNPKRQGGWYQVFFKSLRKHTHGVRSVVSEWAQSVGLYDKRSHERTLPDMAFTLNEGGVARLMASLWETDGTICLAGSDDRLTAACAYSTASPRLADQIQYLLARLGVIAGISVVRQGKHRTGYQIGIRGGREGIGHFLNQMPFVSVFHNAMKVKLLGHIAKLHGESTTTLRGTDGILYESIRRIDAVGAMECFDLTVPGPANMEAGMFVAHNSIEQDADVVMLLHREDYYHRGEEKYEDTNIAEVIIAKQRNGPTGTVKLHFHGETMRFNNLAFGGQS
jgi:replicative DNA helicase